MWFISTFIPPDDRRAALLLYGLVLATCFSGYDSGIMTVILADKQFKDYYHVDAQKLGTISIIPWATQGLAQLYIGGTLSSLVGRLWAMRLSISFMMIGVVVQSVPNNYAVLLVGRLLTGLGAGCSFIAANLWLAEASPTKLRGSFVGTVTQFGYQLGTLIAFWVGYGMKDYTSPFNIAWRVSNLIQIPIGLIFIAVSFWYPESPRWILERHPDQPEHALNQLAYLRDGSPEEERIQIEFHELVASYEYRKKFDPGYIGLFKSAAMRKRLAFGVYATALQQFGGIAAVTMYAAVIYESLGWSNGKQALAINGIQSVLQLFVVLVNTFTVDRYGRRPLLLTGFSIQTLALLVMASLTTSLPNNDNRSAAVAEVAMLFIVGLTYCWSNGPIAPTIASEIFPQHVRDKAFGLSLMGQTVCLIALTQPWPKLNEEIHGKSYWLLFTLNAVALISVFFIMPETKGISLERMDELFGGVDTVQAGEQQQAAEGTDLDTYKPEIRRVDSKEKDLDVKASPATVHEKEH
ncbi:MFS sugar transporter-like protein [Microthyrium microscopicum]|uniref:MFS sugar transporter-like protein n=1 Tax=Microthyrium microscopicum TaxID=703497 RepID=A0A6A6UMB3_9PEZI|nr:MFS sugar transporter-like protein [Microthyrium microscopicum]